MSAAKVIKFPTQQQPVEPSKERSVADCDNGYTRISNDILETAYKLRINGNAMSVLLAVARMTYGWNKASDRIAGVQLADETGLSESEVSLAVKTLLARNIITAAGDKRKVKTIGINKNVSEWILCKPTRSHVQTQKLSCANADYDLCKHTNTKDIIPKTLNQRQDQEIYGPNQAGADSEPAKSEIKIPLDAAIHEQRGKSLKWGTAEDLRCAEWLIDTRAKAFTAKGLPIPKKPSIAGWANDIRLMRTTDHRTHYEIGELFMWVCKTGRELEFCQSPAKLREKWDNLQLRKANAERGVTGYQKPLSNIAAAQLAARASGVTYDDNEPL